jgi:RNA polymerase sigma factor (sigma-70 family)
MSANSSVESIEKAWSNRFHRWRGYAISLTGNWTDAEEIIQEALAKTLRARPHLETERDAHRYILAAVRSTAMQLFAGRRRMRLVEDERQLDRADAGADPLRVYLDSEAEGTRRALLKRALNAMSELRPECRQAVEMLVLREPPLKLREVAEIQQAPISTVHSRLRAALRELAEVLCEGDGESG